MNPSPAQPKALTADDAYGIVCEALTDELDHRSERKREALRRAASALYDGACIGWSLVAALALLLFLLSTFFRRSDS